MLSDYLFSLQLKTIGEMTEWSNVIVLKTIEPLRAPRVRIPISPHYENRA